MTKPAYLVEGDLEQSFIQKVCPGSKVQKIGMNGNKVQLTQIAQRVGSLARLLHKRHSPIVVVFDREDREATSEQIEKELKLLLEKEDIEVPVVVSVADRQIENWILADYETFCKNSGAEAEMFPGTFDGQKGKSIIKGRIPRKSIYIETIQGVDWLKKSRPHVMSKHSASFSRLLEMLRGFDCWWINQEFLKLTREDD